MRAQRTSGHTLVEVMVVVTVMAIFLSAVGLISMRTSSAFQEGSRAAALDAGLHRAVELIARELEDAGREMLDPVPTLPLGSSTLGFNAVEDYTDTIVWGPARRIAWEREPGEVDDGLDNDGDGLVDEGRVVWCELPDQPDERRRVLVSGVMELDQGELANMLDDDKDGLIDERGLAFVMEGDVLRVQLSIQGVDEDGHVRTRSAGTSIYVQNGD
jgi:prepilin-type N-terminal cleavage/methylation domain-containing protein